MAINEIVAGADSIAIHGTASGEKSRGVIGKADGTGVMGDGVGTGVWGRGQTWMGVYGESRSTTGGAGVMGQGDPGPGVIGKSTGWMGVYGESRSTNGGSGVMGDGDPGPGVIGKSTGWMGVYGESKSTNGGAGVMGRHITNQGPGIVGEGAPAGRFIGDVEVTGDIRLTNADCAEDFDVAVDAAPGSVMVLSDTGGLSPCRTAYDGRVVGVLSGAGTFRPAIILDRREPLAGEGRGAVALVGKVYCRVDATHGPIAVGDLLTSSATPGHAMKAADPQRSFGAVLGKALAPARDGTALIPILVTLQ